MVLQLEYLGMHKWYRDLLEWNYVLVVRRKNGVQNEVDGKLWAVGQSSWSWLIFVFKVSNSDAIWMVIGAVCGDDILKYPFYVLHDDWLLDMMQFQGFSTIIKLMRQKILRRSWLILIGQAYFDLASAHRSDQKSEISEQMDIMMVPTPVSLWKEHSVYLVTPLLHMMKGSIRIGNFVSLPSTLLHTRWDLVFKSILIGEESRFAWSSQFVPLGQLGARTLLSYAKKWHTKQLCHTRRAAREHEGGRCERRESS